MSVIEMPRLSDSMQDGLIVSWLKQDGEPVSEGEDLLEIETDKATMVHVAEAAGVLHILVAAGTTVAVGVPIAEVGEADAPPLDSAPRVPDPVRPAVAGPTEPTPAPANDRSPRATPLARRLARAHGVSLDEISGTGPLGRITRADVLAKAGVQPQPGAGVPLDTGPATRQASGASAGRGEVRSIELTRLQALVARRMVEAKSTVPHFQVQTDVVMDEAVRLRSEIRGLDRAVSVNDLVIRAAALALCEHPTVNGSFQGDRFELYSRINIGAAVAADGALVVPTIFDADRKSLGTIALEMAALSARVRDGSITPSELEGATFTISNLGMYGMTSITPVINPPQAAILGVGAVREELARQHGKVVDRQLMTLTLSCDHRILYGADAARFLARVRELLERPLALLL